MDRGFHTAHSQREGAPRIGCAISQPQSCFRKDYNLCPFLPGSQASTEGSATAADDDHIPYHIFLPSLKKQNITKFPQGHLRGIYLLSRLPMYLSQPYLVS